MLQRIGDWYSRVREAFDAEPVPGLTDNPNVLTTRNGNTIYAHLHEAIGDGLVLHPIREMPERVVLLNDGREMAARVDHLPMYHRETEPCLHIPRLPVDEMQGEVMVLRLDFADGV
jgi:hypothetical protein